MCQGPSELLEHGPAIGPFRGECCSSYQCSPYRGVTGKTYRLKQHFLPLEGLLKLKR